MKGTLSRTHGSTKNSKHIQINDNNPCDDGRFPTIFFELSGQCDHLLFQPKNMDTLDENYLNKFQNPPQKNLSSDRSVFLFSQASFFVIGKLLKTLLD